MVDVNNTEAVKSFLSEKDNIAFLLRAFEIIGECVQNISYEIRELDPLIPWKSKNKNNKKTDLHDFRTYIQHCREKVELIIEYEPEFFKELLNGVLFLHTRIEMLLNLASQVSPNEKDFSALNTNITAKIQAILTLKSEKGKKSDADLQNKANTTHVVFVSSLREIMLIVDYSTKLNGSKIEFLLSLLNPKSLELYKMLMDRKDKENERELYHQKLSKTEGEFLKLVNLCLDLNRLKELGLTVADANKEFKEAYRALQGFKFSFSEIEEALAAPHEMIQINIVEIKERIKKVVLGREIMNGNTFQKQCLDPLIFAAKDIPGVQRNSEEDRIEKEINDLRIMMVQKLDLASILELFNLDKEELKKHEADCITKVQESCELLSKFKDLGNLAWSNFEKENIKKDNLKKLIGLTESDLDRLYQLLKKKTLEEVNELRQNDINKSERIKKQILSEAKWISEKPTITKKKQLENMLKDLLGLSDEQRSRILQLFQFPPQKMDQKSTDELEEILAATIQTQGAYQAYFKKSKVEQVFEARIAKLGGRRTLPDDVNEMERILQKIPRDKEAFQTLLTQTKDDITKLLVSEKINGNDEHVTKEFESKLKILAYSDSRVARLRNKFAKDLHLRDPKMTELKLDKLLGSIRFAYEELKEVLESEAFTKQDAWQEQDFVTLVEKAGYKYSPVFDALYSRFRNRSIMHSDIMFVVEKIENPADQKEIYHMLDNPTIIKENEGAEKKNFLKLLKGYQPKEGLTLAKYVEQALVIFEKSRISRINLNSVHRLREEFKATVEKIAYIFRMVHNRKKMTTLQKNHLVLLLEYYIEAAGDAAERLSIHKDFSESTHISFSFKYLVLLAVCRKSMAHYPLEINMDLIDYLFKKLVLDTRLRVEESETSISLATVANDSLLQKHCSVTIADLKRNKMQIFMAIEGLGFKSNFRIFHRSMGCDIGVQADICFLVTRVAFHEGNVFNVFELELRLSQLLKANVHVYIDTELPRTNRLKVTDRHIALLREQAKDIESIIVEAHFENIFKEGCWSAAQTQVGRVEISDYIEKKNIEETLLFIFGKKITFEELINVLKNPDIFVQKLKERFAEYEADKGKGKLLSEFLNKVRNWLVQPTIIRYEPVSIPIGASLDFKGYITPVVLDTLKQRGGLMPKNYPALLVPEILPQDPSFACISTYKLWKDSVAPEIIRKLASTPDFHLTICAPTSTLCFQGLQYNFNIRKNKLAAELDKSSIITMDELWKYNNLMYQQSHEPRKMEIYSNWVVHNTVSGFGIVVKLQNNGSLIINHQTYFVELSREEMDLLYIEQDESVGRYEKFDKSFCMILHEISNNKTIIKYVHGMTQYIARIFMYNGSRLIKMFDPQKRIDASLFSKASAVEYVFKRQDLKAERDAARILREKRRKDSKSINEMIAGKAKSYMEKARVILRHEQKHHEDRMEPLSNLLLIDKKINRLLSGYIIDNETDILRLYDMQDKRQKTVTTALSTLKLLPNPVMTKEDFQTMVRIDPNIVKDEELRNKVIELLKQRREILISLWEVFQCENQDGTLKILEDETAERDHEFVAQFGDLLETYERDSSNGRQVARKGLLLIRAYEYYMKFDLILEPVLNPEIIRLLFLLYPDRSKEVEKLIYQDFVHRYGDATNANVCFISPIRTVTQVDFCSEIEYCNFRREVDKLQILSCKEYYTRMLKVASEWCKQVNTLKREEYRMQYEYQVPTLAEEILSYSSELDGRELRNIYAHVADPEHHSKRIAMAPDFFVEELPTLWKEKKLKRNYAGETKGTSKFDFRLKTLDELFDFHRWTPAEKEKYRKCHNYNGDNQQIKDYSEFREAFDLLTTTIARINEYERNIEKCYCDISKHEKIGRALEASSLRADLELYISGYDNNIKEQNRLIELIMNLAFTQNRMLCVFRNSDKLDTMMTFLESFEPTPGFTENDQSLIIEKLVGFVLFKIRDETQRQLLRTTNAKLTWNPQIFAIKQNLAIQGKCGEESMELSLESLATAPAFNPMYAATKQSNPRTAQIVSEHPHTLPIGTIENGQQKRL